MKNGAIFISLIEYVLVSGAVVNTWQVTWQLTTLTVASFSHETSYQPMLWAALTVLIYIAGAVAVQLRMRFVTESDNADAQHTHKRRTWSKLISDTFDQEFKISGLQTKAKLALRDENIYFLICSWLTSGGTVVHMIYGTLVFSSTLFISSQDSEGVAGRYLSSVSICRVVLAYEFSGLRQTIDASAAQIYVRTDQLYNLENPNDSDEIKFSQSLESEHSASQPHVEMSKRSTFGLRPLCNDIAENHLISIVT